MVPVRRHARDWRAYFACGGLVLAFLVMTLKGKRQHSSNDAKNRPRNHPDPAKPFPPSHRLSHYNHPSEEEHRTAEQINWIDAYTLNVGIAVAAVVTVFLAIGTFWETRIQAGIAQGQLDSTNSGSAQTDKAIAEAHRSADAAQEAVRVASAAAQINTRAYLAPEGLFETPDSFISHGEFNSIEMLITNVGRSPATKTNIIINSGTALIDALKPGHTLTQPNISCLGIEPKPGGQVYYPNHNSTIDSVIIPTNQEPFISDLSDIRSGKRIIYVEGCIVYVTGNVIHHSEYCLYLRPIPAENPTGWRSVACPNGNDAD